MMKGYGRTLHLDILVDRLRREFKSRSQTLVRLRLPYRETISREAESRYTLKKQSGRFGQFAEVKMILMPTGRRRVLLWKSRIVGGGCSKEYIRRRRKRDQLGHDSGPLAGFPVMTQSWR